MFEDINVSENYLVYCDDIVQYAAFIKYGKKYIKLVKMYVKILNFKIIKNNTMKI